jgi:hypothetical protein
LKQSKNSFKSEKQIETEIRKYLEFSLSAYINKNHGSGFTKPGRPDLEGCLKGRHFGIEVKNEKGELSDEQRVHLRNIKKAGGIAIAARSLDFVKKVLSKNGLI